MWDEPLSAMTFELHRYASLVTVRDGSGRAVASVKLHHNIAAGSGYFGEMHVLDADGAPRQRVRALVLLTRAALAWGADHGITAVTTHTPPRLEAFAARVSGLAPSVVGGARRFAGELHAIRTHALDVSDADGNLSGADTDPDEVSPGRGV